MVSILHQQLGQDFALAIKSCKLLSDLSTTVTLGRAKWAIPWQALIISNAMMKQWWSFDQIHSACKQAYETLTGIITAYSRIDCCSVIFLSWFGSKSSLILNAVGIWKLHAQGKVLPPWEMEHLCCSTSVSGREGEDTGFDVRINHACYYLCLAESGHCSVYSLLFQCQVNKSRWLCLRLLGLQIRKVPCVLSLESPCKTQEPVPLAVAVFCPVFI